MQSNTEEPQVKLITEPLEHHDVSEQNKTYGSGGPEVASKGIGL